MKWVFLFLVFVMFSAFESHNTVDLKKQDIFQSNTLTSFTEKLAALDSSMGQLSIVHIGDSHIQADFFSGAVRKKLQDRFGNAGRGFVFPYKIARSGGALDVRFTYEGVWQYCHIKRSYANCNMGLAGYSVTPLSGASFSIDVVSKAETDASFTKVTFLDNYGSFLPIGMQGTFVPLKENKHTAIYFDEPQEKLTFKPAYQGSTMPELQGMILENGQPGILYHALGVNGSTVSQYLRSNDFTKQISELNASLVIISFGTNDCYTTPSKYCDGCQKENYRKLINKIREQNPDISILLTTPPDHYYYRKYPNKNIQKLVDGMYELASEEGVAIWDLYAAMGGAGSISQWQKEGLSRGDLIHFTKDGYQLQGDMLYNALINTLE